MSDYSKVYDHILKCDRARDPVSFGTGIISLNSLIANYQTLQVGSSGSDFNISSLTSTHTFNLPTASSANRGALSSTDWTTFNNKENVITFNNPLYRTGNNAYIYDASISQKGAVQLSNSYVGTSQILATTEKALSDGLFTKLNKLERIVFVAKSGGDFNTIQAAIDSITDATENKRYAILIAPGYYNETITAKPYITLYGLGDFFAVQIYQINVSLIAAAAEAVYFENIRIFGTSITMQDASYGKTVVFTNCSVPAAASSFIASGQDKIGHQVIIRNSFQYADAVFNGDLFLSSEQTGWALGATLNDNVVMQHSSAELNGTFTLNDNAQAYIRNDSVHAYPLIVSITININDDAILNVDADSYATMSVNRGIGVTDSQIQILGGISAGMISVIPSYTDNGGTPHTITVHEGQCFIYDNDHQFGLPRRFIIPEKTLTLTDQVNNHIQVNYNSGVPQYENALTETANDSDIIPFWRIFKNGTELHSFNWDALGEGLPNKLHQRIVKTDPFARESGLGLGEAATRLITIESGKGYYGAVSISFDAFNSSTDDLYFYYWNGSTWIEDLTKTQYNNSQYQGTGGLVSALPNKYLVNFIFRGLETDAHCYFVLGTQEYSQTAAGLIEAERAQIPANLPDIIKEHSFLVGKIIVLTAATTATSIQSAFEQQFTISPATDHGSLSGLTDDDHLQYALITHKFWVSQSETRLTNSVNLGALTTGILKHSVSGGVSTPSTAIGGTDYEYPLTFSTGLLRSTNIITVDINGTTAEATPDDADKILIYDNSASALKSQTRANFLSGISAAPAGSNGEVQFNNSGAFGADSNFYWNNTSKKLALGNSGVAETGLLGIAKTDTDPILSINYKNTNNLGDPQVVFEENASGLFAIGIDTANLNRLVITPASTIGGKTTGLLMSQTGDITISDNLAMGTNKKLTFGSFANIEQYLDSSGNWILRHTIQDKDIIFYANYGGVDREFFRIDGSAPALLMGVDLNTNSNDIKLLDNDKAIFGTGNDAEIYSDGNDLIVRNLTLNKNIDFYLNYGGIDTRIININGSGKYVYVNGFLGLGVISTPLVSLHTGAEGGANNPFLADCYGGTSGNRNAFTFRRWGGSYASPSAVTSGWQIYGMFGGAYDGTSIRQTSFIEGYVDTFTGTDNVSGYIDFGTRNDGAGATSTRRLRLEKNGNITLWATAGCADCATLKLQEKDTTPANPTASTEAKMYMKSDKLVIQFNDAGTIKYFYLNLTATTDQSLIYTTTAP